MSTVVSWATKDTNGLASIYFISESRITWKNSNEKWDYGQKVFSLRHGGIIAYAGEVLFPIQIISQLIHLIDKEILFKDNDQNSKKIHIIETYIRDAFQSYPKSLDKSHIIIALAEKEEFNYYELSFEKGSLNLYYSNIEANAPKFYGSGKGYFKTTFKKLEGDEIYSRDIYQAFYKTMQDTKAGVERTDKNSGGIIQLTGIYRNGESKTFGILDQGNKYIYGQKITSLNIESNVEWRNENFEIIDIKTMKIKEGAQRQPFNKKLLN